MKPNKLTRARVRTGRTRLPARSVVTHPFVTLTLKADGTYVGILEFITGDKPS